MSRAGLGALWREPLAQFLAYGALLFAAQALLTGLRPPERGRIELPPGQRATLRAELTAQWRRPPSETELAAATRSWIDEELLFREALALGLERSDPIVRRRLVQKMEALVESGLEGETPSDAELQALLEATPARYGQPERFHFEQIFFSRGRRGERLHAEAEAALRRLQAEPRAAIAGDVFFAGRELAGLDAVAARKLFGAEFAQALSALPLQRWVGPVASGYGLHLLRLTGRRAATPATLAEARPQLLADWRLQRRQELLERRLAALRPRYPVVPAEELPPAPAAANPEAALAHFD